MFKRLNDPMGARLSPSARNSAKITSPTTPPGHPAEVAFRICRGGHVTSMKAPPTRLEQRIIRMRKLQLQAIEDGEQLFIDMAESDLNRLLDQLPRTSHQSGES